MTATSAKQNLEVIQLCREIELANAELYELLARLHAADSDAQQLWRKTAAEELEHARQFDVVLQAGAEALRGLRVNRARAMESLGRVRELCEGWRGSPPTVTMALELTIQMEREFARFHSDMVLVFAVEHYQRLFRTLSRADHGHVRQLEQELARRRRA